MKIDSIEDWAEELRKQHFNISDTTWRLLRLSGQYQTLTIVLRENLGLQVSINNAPCRTYPFGYSVGAFRMILARIGKFYMESSLADTGLYGFIGQMEIEDNFGSKRILDIDMKNNVKEGFSLNIKVTNQT